MGLSPWVTRATIARDGAVFACEGADAPCGKQAAQMLGKVDNAAEAQAQGPAPEGQTRDWHVRLYFRLPGA